MLVPSTVKTPALVSMCTYVLSRTAVWGIIQLPHPQACVYVRLVTYGCVGYHTTPAPASMCVRLSCYVRMCGGHIVCDSICSELALIWHSVITPEPKLLNWSKSVDLLNWSDHNQQISWTDLSKSNKSPELIWAKATKLLNWSEQKQQSSWTDQNL